MVMVIVLMRNTVQLCLAANNILHMRKGNRAFLLLAIALADRFASRGYLVKKQTRWSNDKTIIELGYRKISWFVSVRLADHASADLLARQISSNNC